MMLNFKVAFLAIAAVLTVVLSACGDDDGGTPTPSASETTPEPTEPFDAGPLGPNGVDLETAPTAFTIETGDRGDLAILSSDLAVGDYDGDGTPDLAVGASYDDGPENERFDTGAVYVIFDSDSLTDKIVLSEETAGFVVYGVELEEFHGFQVESGDLNSDGTDDLILTAPGITAGADLRTDQGRVYVFFGGPGLTGTVDLAEGDEPWDFVLTGAEGFSRAGHSIDTGDINGDGMEDLVVAAPFAGREPGSPPGGPRTGAGAVYAIYGGPGLGGEVNIAFDDPDFWITAEEEFGQFANSIAVGDLNGDGVDDISIGAPQLDTEQGPDSGSVFVFYGSASLEQIVQHISADVIIRPASDEDGLGFRVAILGSASGPDRLVASAVRADGPDDARPAAGDVYVLDVSSPGVIELSQSDPLAVIYGAEMAMSLGQEIATGDLDGDGSADIALGAPSAKSRNGTVAVGGMTLVIFGPDISGEVDSDEGDGFHWYEGREPDGQSGSPVVIADPEGDGVNSLLIGSARSGLSGERPGQIRAISVER